MPQTKWRRERHSQHVYRLGDDFAYSVTDRKKWKDDEHVSAPPYFNTHAEASQAAKAELERLTALRGHKSAVQAPSNGEMDCALDERKPAAVAKRGSVKKDRRKVTIKKPKWRPFGDVEFVYKKGDQYAYLSGRRQEYKSKIDLPIYYNTKEEASQAAQAAELERLAALGGHESAAQAPYGGEMDLDERKPSAKKPKKPTWRRVDNKEHVYRLGDDFAYSLEARQKWKKNDHVSAPPYFKTQAEAAKVANAELERLAALAGHESAVQAPSKGEMVVVETIDVGNEDYENEICAGVRKLDCAEDCGRTTKKARVFG